MAIQARIKPRTARKQQLQQRALELRAARKSYRAIGSELGTSHAWARALCERAFRDAAERILADATQELGSILAAQDEALALLHREMTTADTSADRSRAASAFARVLHDRARMLGLGAPERVQIEGVTRAEATWMEVKDLGEEQLDAELRSFGWRPVAELEPAGSHEDKEKNGGGEIVDAVL
jgi:hypothetical protein